jgi:hypothetical protein
MSRVARQADPLSCRYVVADVDQCTVLLQMVVLTRRAVIVQDYDEVCVAAMPCPSLPTTMAVAPVK